MKQNWFKYTYVCSICDALIEITNKTNVYAPHICCNLEATWLSVADATIAPSTTTKEETMEETTTPQVMTLDWVENDVVTSKTYTESDIRHMVWLNKNLTTKQNEWFKKESQLRTLLEEVYADSSEQETLAEIAEMFDVPLTKEIEVTVWVRVDATVEVDLTGDFDGVEDFVSSNLTVDSYASEMSVNNFEIDRVEEGAY